MCHHVDMAIDWDEVVTEEQRESSTDEFESTPDTDEPAVEADESPLEAAPPADD